MKTTITLDTNSKIFRHVFVGTALTLSAVCFTVAAYSWTGPTSSPPGNNVAAPVNVGSADQVKSGGLWVGSLGIGGSAIVEGSIGIGTSNPSSNLHVSDTGDASILIEADTNNSGEGDQPILILSQDGGAVTGTLGFYGSSNHLRLMNHYSNGDLVLGAGGITNVVIKRNGDLCLDGSCKASWSSTGSSRWTGYEYIAAGAPTVSCSSGEMMTGIGTKETNGDYRVDQIRIRCTDIAP